MTESETLCVFAPASVSNVACGFDTLGFAIGTDESLGDLITVEPTASSANAAFPVTITAISGDQGRLPKDAARNTAAVAAAAVLDAFHVQSDSRVTLSMVIEKRMPLCSGLGSSAASAVGGAVAAYELLRRKYGFELSEPELIECALAGEVVASGGRHADNVAPCMLGGFVLVRCLADEPDVVRLPDCDDWLWCALARPSIAIDTLSSRQRLGQSVELSAAIHQWANLGALVAALYERDEHLLARALHDHIAEPVRKTDVTGFDEAMSAALDAGALGGSLSGSGPTLFSLATSEAIASDAAHAMAQALTRAGHGECDAQVSPVGTTGARVVSS